MNTKITTCLTSRRIQSFSPAYFFPYKNNVIMFIALLLWFTNYVGPSIGICFWCLNFEYPSVKILQLDCIGLWTLQHYFERSFKPYYLLAWLFFHLLFLINQTRFNKNQMLQHVHKNVHGFPWKSVVWSNLD